MKLKVGVMGSANDTLPGGVPDSLRATAEALGDAIASRDLFLLTGATTGVTQIVANSARAAGGFHIGISPAANEDEHLRKYELPLQDCDSVIYTGFGLKGRNVVLVRSCDVVLFIGGSMGSLNEFTIAHDEGRVIGCLTGTGGVADEAERLLRIFPKRSGACVLHGDDPKRLLAACLEAYEQTRKAE